jgi:glycosyltransferase involved in cell wall biosynthesis
MDMIGMLKIACIPAFNEEKIIEDIIRRCKVHVDKVIVCDDGSKDNTSDVATKAGAVVLQHKQNQGKGTAMKTLFDYAKKIDADIMITIDGDGQFLPEEIPKIMKPIVKENVDIVIGYRFNDNEEMPSYRKIGNKMLDKFTNLASELPFRDTQGGFRAYSKRAINTINITTKGFGVDSEILVNASKKGLKIVEEKVTVIYNTGNSTSTKGPISHSTEVIVSLLEIIAINHPLRYLGLPGIGLMTIGIIFGIFVLVTFNEIRYFSIPFTLISMATIMIGIILLLMSVVLFSIAVTQRRKY